MALSVSHVHANGQTIRYPRPDRVTKTGVIAPYPIRQCDPVKLARNTIRPFINDIRPMGPQLDVSLVGLGAAPGAPGVHLPQSPATMAMQMACAARRTAPMPPQRGIPPMMAAMRRHLMPNGMLRYEYDAGRAQYAYNQAAARGTIWDILRARAHEIKLMKR